MRHQLDAKAFIVAVIVFTVLCVISYASGAASQ